MKNLKLISGDMIPLNKCSKIERMKQAYAIKIGAIKAKKLKYDFGLQPNLSKMMYILKRKESFWKKHKQFDVNKVLQIKGGDQTDNPQWNALMKRKFQKDSHMINSSGSDPYFMLNSYSQGDGLNQFDSDFQDSSTQVQAFNPMKTFYKT